MEDVTAQATRHALRPRSLLPAVSGRLSINTKCIKDDDDQVQHRAAKHIFPWHILGQANVDKQQQQENHRVEQENGRFACAE